MSEAEVTQEENQQTEESFKPINSQADLDAIIKERVERAENKGRKLAQEELSAEIEKAKKFDELEEANKSEMQKLLERAEKAEGELKTMKEADQLRAWREEASTKSGVEAKLIRGNTLDEMLEHANSIADFIKSKPKYESVPNSGKPSTATETNDIDDILREAAGLKKKG